MPSGREGTRRPLRPRRRRSPRRARHRFPARLLHTTGIPVRLASRPLPGARSRTRETLRVLVTSGGFAWAPSATSFARSPHRRRRAHGGLRRARAGEARHAPAAEAGVKARVLGFEKDMALAWRRPTSSSARPAVSRERGHDVGRPMIIGCVPGTKDQRQPRRESRRGSHLGARDVGMVVHAMRVHRLFGRWARTRERSS